MRLVVEGRVERDPATYEYVGIGVNRQRLAASQTVYSLESLGLVTLATDGSIGPTAAGEAVLDADERRRLET